MDGGAGAPRQVLPPEHEERGSVGVRGADRGAAIGGEGRLPDGGVFFASNCGVGRYVAEI